MILDVSHLIHIIVIIIMVITLGMLYSMAGGKLGGKKLMNHA